MATGAPQHNTAAPGLDRGIARRHAFLNAARSVFLEHGYEAASVNDVVRLAGGSLATLYAQFKSKEGLFLAVVQDQHERLMAAMIPPCVDHLDIEPALQLIGEQFLRAILTRENRAFFRLVVSEGRKFPQEALGYVSSGADKVRGVVAARLQASTLRLGPEADIAASYFLELVRSRHHYRAVVDDHYVLGDDDLARHVARAVGFLVAGLRAT